MKTTILLAALAAFTCQIWAQQNPGGTGTVTGPPVTTVSSYPTLTAEQKLSIRDVQVPMLNASREFQAYMVSIQKQVEAQPEYQRLKAAADAANEKFNAVAREAMDKVKCADCQLNTETLTLSRPQQAAKVDAKATEKK
jgi:hypothetical protein